MPSSWTAGWTVLVLHAAAVDDVPPVEPPPAPPADLSSARRPLRIAVYELELAGIEGHWGRVVTASVLAELRKLERVSVIGMTEIRAMLDLEAQKQLTGCSDASCLADIADALGVDVLVTGALARVGDEHVFGLKRLDQRAAKVTGTVDRRFTAGNGEELLVAVGPAVAQLFPEVPLRPGVERGVAKELALRLNPPPLPAWVFWSGTAAAALSAATAGVLFGVNLAADADYRAYKAGGVIDIDVEAEKAGAVEGAAYAAYAAGGAAAAFGIATGVAGLFTDFWGYAEMNEEIAR